MIICSKNECCGCGLCAVICPRKAISMQPDAEGFLFPEINTELCCNCSLCNKECPVNKANIQTEHPTLEHHCYYAIAADTDTVASASSGGIFPTIARKILEQGGAVIGGAFDANFNVKLILVENEKNLEKLKQAKYVQAEIPQDLFGQAEEVLKNGRRLLFSGTPCQIAAFKNFLKGKEYPDLLLCAEVICHSVPSPGVWQSYLRYLTETNGDRVKSVAFRDKSAGWHKFSLVINYGDKKNSQTHKESPYMQLFLQGLISRKSCTDCRFKCGYSGADLSLGDFWKLHKIKPELNNSTGVSMVITHTPAGETALHECNVAVLKEFTMDAVKISNPRFFDSHIPNPKRDKYFEKFAECKQKWFAPDDFLKKSSKRSLLHKIVAFFKPSK